MTAAFTEQQADRLAELVAAERRRLELDPWGPAGVKAALRQVADRDLIEVTAAFLRAARTASLRTPAVAAMDGPHWQQPKPEPATPRPPRRDEECDRHPGSWAERCHGCAADRHAGTASPQAGSKADRWAERVADLRKAVRPTRQNGPQPPPDATATEPEPQTDNDATQEDQ